MFNREKILELIELAENAENKEDYVKYSTEALNLSKEFFSNERYFKLLDEKVITRIFIKMYDDGLREYNPYKSEFFRRIVVLTRLIEKEHGIF